MEEIKIKVNCFNLKYTLTRDLVFRWKYLDGYYVGVIKDRVIKIRQDKDYLYVKSNNMDNIENVVRDYFELDKDYESIEKRIVKVDDYVKEAIKNTSGLKTFKSRFF